MPDNGVRITELGSADVGYADGYPFLIASEESLNDLNSRMENSLPMDRFRPNIVVRGGLPFEEDSFGKFIIREILFDTVKPCARCPITTIDQLTGKAGKEPLKTLAKFRFRDNAVHFGMNLVHSGIGTISIGDELIFS